MVISNFVNEATLFFKLLRTDFNEVGALFPTSSISAKALCSELQRHRGTKRILNNAGSRRENMLRRAGGTDDQIDLAGVDIGNFECFARCNHCQ